jgi:hypothetical protein
MARTQKQDREWIIKMAEAESETLGGILVGSVNFIISVPTDVVEMVKAKMLDTMKPNVL